MRWSMLVVAGVLLPMIAGAVPVYTDAAGREWLDLNDTRYRSWSDTAARCDHLSGMCSGVLATNTLSSSDIDVTGFTWASRDDVRSLWYEIGALPMGSLDDYHASFSSADGFGANALSIFEPTIQLPSGPGVDNVLNGVTREVFMDPLLGLRARTGIIYDSFVGTDGFTLNGSFDADMREISMGVYLYRDARQVPEPGPLALFASALVGLAIARKHRAARAARHS